MPDAKPSKVLPVKLDENEGDEALYSLTFRQARALLSQVDYLGWMTRHVLIPDDLNSPSSLGAWVDNLKERLMKEIPPMEDVCSAIIDCIAEDPLTQEALFDTLLANEDFLKRLTEKIVPLLPSQLTETLNPSEGCDHDVLWAQCLAIATFTHDTVLDALDVIEVQSNNVELMRTLKLIPGVKVALAAIPIDEAIEWANWWQENVKEQYDANWDDSETPDGTAWKIAEALFCICYDDCVITLDRVWNAYTDLLSGSVSISWDTLQDIVEYSLGVNDNSLVLVYTLHSLMWGLAKLTSSIGLDSYDAGIIKIILKLATDDASHDWFGLVDCVPADIDIVIDDEPFLGGGGFGVITYDGEYTVVTSEYSGFDHRLTIKDSLGRPFQMTNFTAGARSCTAWTLGDNTQYFDGCAGIEYTSQVIRDFLRTSNVSTYIRFIPILSE